MTDSVAVKRAVNNKCYEAKKRKAFSLRKIYDMSDMTKCHIKHFCSDNRNYLTLQDMCDVFGVSLATLKEIMKES